MTEAPKRSVAASVRGRLLNLSKQRWEDFNLTLTRYAQFGVHNRCRKV